MSTEIPVPAWKRTRQRASARPPLTREVIVDTALRVLDAEGLDGVTMRRVAEELETGAASLYAHVANKEELLDLLYDRVAAAIEVPKPDPERWQDQLHAIGMRMHAILQEHRDLAAVTLGSVPTGPNTLRVAEGVFAIMIAGGVPPKVAGWMLDRLALYINSDAYEGSIIHKRQRASGLPMEQFLEDYLGKVQDFYRNLPRDRFPTLTEHLDEMMSGDSDERFAFGLDMMIRSLASYAQPSTGAP